MRVSKFRISNLGPISQPLDLLFDSRVNVLIGPNGCGKSTVVREVYRAVTERLGVRVDGYPGIEYHGRRIDESNTLRVTSPSVRESSGIYDPCR